MPNFTYKAIGTDKTILEGVMTAGTREEVAQILVKKNLSPLTVRPVSESSSVRGTVPQIDKITFCRYMAVMLKSGLSMSEGLEVLLTETKHPLMKRILGDMLYSLEQGQQLSIIFGKYPDVFEPFFITLTHAGEVSGQLAEVFNFMEEELRSEYRLNAKVKGALLYPTIVLSAAVVMGLGLFFFILPQIGKVFLSLKMPLPLMTKMMFESSIFLSRQLIWVFFTMVGLGVVTYILTIKGIVQKILFHAVRPVPFVRELIKKIDMARFNRIFSTLLRSAVPITEALEISLKSLSWFEYQALVKKLPDEIRKGKSLSEAIKAKKVFPPLLVQMIAAGEKTATLDETLADMAQFYEEEVEEELKGLTQVLEPVMMLVVGIIVGVMILSIISPIYSVIGNFQNAGAGR